MALTDFPVAIPCQTIAAFSQRNYVRRLSLFGSVLTSLFTERRDIDMIVEFMPGRIPGFVELSGMGLELSVLSAVKADLRTAGELSRYFRAKVLASGCPTV